MHVHGGIWCFCIVYLPVDNFLVMYVLTTNINYVLLVGTPTIFQVEKQLMGKFHMFHVLRLALIAEGNRQSRHCSSCVAILLPSDGLPYQENYSYSNIKQTEIKTLI